MNILKIKSSSAFTRVVDFRLTKMFGIFARRQPELSPRRKFTTGFTLIELMVVISIISFISSVVLASMQSARNRAIDAKITEDLRQVKTAADIYYAGKQSYLFSVSDNANKNVVVDNVKGSHFDDFNPLNTKTANAEVGPPSGCVVFNNVAGNLVAAKYLAAMPIHPRQDYSKGICYKAATSTDGSYLAAYGQLSSSVSISGVSTPQNTGFVLGDTSIPTLQAIYGATGGEYPATASLNTQPTSIASIVNQIQGITNGVRGTYSSSGGSVQSTYTLSINPNGATPFYIDDVTPADFNPKTYPAGTEVRLLAYKDSEPATYWTGGCDNDAPGQTGGLGFGSSCFVTMNSNKSMSPIFVYYNFSSSIQSFGGGTGYINGASNGSYISGKSLNLTAVPTNGSYFMGWALDASSCGTNLNCTITMTGDKSVSARFSH